MSERSAAARPAPDDLVHDDLLPALQTDPRTVWATPLWRAAVEEWIDGALHLAGAERLGPLDEVRIRPWSIHLTAQTTAGRFWFKENHPGQRFEAGLVDALAGLVPEHVVAPIAFEPEWGWLLSPDNSETLASSGTSEVADWQRIVIDFAHVQQRVAGAEAALLAAGLEPLGPDNTSGLLAARVEQMAADPPSIATSLEAGLASSVLAALPGIERIFGRLADLPGGLSLQHNDLHANNVFRPREGETELRFFDFGDALWAHPFAVLGVPLRVLGDAWEADVDDARIRAVTDAYLDVWSAHGSDRERAEALDLALRLTPLHRFESWRRLLVHAPAETHTAQAEAVQYWAGEVAAIRD